MVRPDGAGDGVGVVGLSAGVVAVRAVSTAATVRPEASASGAATPVLEEGIDEAATDNATSAKKPTPAAVLRRAGVGIQLISGSSVGHTTAYSDRSSRGE